MATNKREQIERAASELEVLGGVIDYAEKMMYEAGKRAEYEPLRRHAYGKTVVIDTEKQGRLTFRLSSTPVTYPNYASGYATPHSPVGRLCGFLRVGDEDETPRWGEYRVVEVRLFDRFAGPQFEPNVRNFLHMAVEGESRMTKITDLRAFVSASRGPWRIRSDAPAPSASSDSERPPTVSPAEPVAEPAELTVDVFQVIDEPETDAVGLDIAEDEESIEAVAAAVEESYGLSETFFVNRTREQDAVMSRSPIGPMFVEGIAGSGKTSAALGRTKMLCDFHANGVFDEREFREHVGSDLAYWSGEYAGQFSQEGSVGFVRTGELIQYLKETCRRLDLPNLPIQEYPELRERLRHHWRVDRARPGRRRWGGASDSRSTHRDTTMEWLKSTDRAIAELWAEELPSAIPSVERLVGAFDDEHRQRASTVAAAARERLSAEIARLSAQLGKTQASRGFALDRLAARIDECIQSVRRSVLEKDVLWASAGERLWVARNEHDLAQKLISERIPTFLRSQARVVYVDDRGMLDRSLQLIARSGEPVTWGKTTREAMARGEVRVRDKEGRITAAIAGDLNFVHLALLPESMNRLYFLAGGALRPLSIQRGRGRERLKLAPTASEQSELENDDAEADGAVLEASESGDVDAQQRRRTMDSVFQSEARRALIAPIAGLAEAYSDVLERKAESFPDVALVSSLRQQLGERKLTDEDIDLLLCLAQLVSRESTIPAIKFAAPYQAVFIDEVQDFTEQQVFLMSRQARAEYRAVTVVGDIAQKLHNGNTIDVRACFPGESLPVVQLTENLRQLEAPGLAWFSACFRAEFQDGLAGLKPEGGLAQRMAEHADQLRGPELALVEADDELVERVVSVLERTKPHHTAAVLLPDAAIAAAFFDLCRGALTERRITAEVSSKLDLSRRHVRHFTSVAHSKGLEFDTVIVPYVERYRLDDRADVNRLYVSLTRARKKLLIVRCGLGDETAFDAVWNRYEEGVGALAVE